MGFKARTAGVDIFDDTIRNKALQLADQLGIPKEFSVSSGFADKFKKRHQLVLRIKAGEGAALITAASWEAVPEGTIRNCWRHVHFEPHMEDVPAEQEDAELSDLWSEAANKLNIDAHACSLDDFISADDSATTEEEVTLERVLGDVTVEPREAEDSDADEMSLHHLPLLKYILVSPL